MRKIVIFLAFFISINAHAQLDSLQKQAEKLTAEKIYSDVKSGFSKLVGNLEGPAKHVYGIYVYQHKAEGVRTLLAVLVAFLASLIAWVWIYISTRKKFVDGNDLEWDWAKIIISTILLIVSIGFIIGYFTEDFGKILNPEYYAIQDIIKAFK